MPRPAAIGFLVAAGLVLAACVESPQALYDRAEALRRRGDLKPALELARRGVTRFHSPAQSQWHWPFRLLAAEILLDQRDAPACLDILETPPGPAPAAALEARRLAATGYATVISFPAQATAAAAMLDSAHQIASRAGPPALVAAISLRRSIVRGSGLNTEVFVREALDHARKANDRFYESAALLDLGYVRLQASRFDEAIPWLEQAAALAEAAGAVRLHGRALGNLGLCYYRVGETERARGVLEQALRLSSSVEDHAMVYRWWNNLGNVHHRRGEWAEARRIYRQAADLARRQRGLEFLPPILNNLTMTSLDSGDLDAAERYGLENAPLAKDPEADLRWRFYQARAAVGRKASAAESLLAEVIDAARLNRDPAVLWEAQAHQARLLTSMPGREAGAEAAFRDALATIDVEWTRLGGDEHRIGFL
ncbi:MAG: tetratricopeptide repeat protein, partial [Bryobacteraceae bacterium]